MKKKKIFRNFSLFSPVSLTPLINIHSRIFEKIRNGPNGILRGQGDTHLWKNTDVENLVLDSFNQKSKIVLSTPSSPPPHPHTQLEKRDSSLEERKPRGQGLRPSLAVIHSPPTNFLVIQFYPTSLKGQCHDIFSLFLSTPDYHFLVRFNWLISNIWEIFTTFQ